MAYTLYCTYRCKVKLMRTASFLNPESQPHSIVYPRKYWMIYREPGFLAVLWFGSFYPTHLPTASAVTFQVLLWIACWEFSPQSVLLPVIGPGYPAPRRIASRRRISMPSQSETKPKIKMDTVCHLPDIISRFFLPQKKEWRATTMDKYLKIIMRKINLSQEASGMISQNYMGLPVNIFSVKIVDLGSLKRVTGSIFKISK